MEANWDLLQKKWPVMPTTLGGWVDTKADLNSVKETRICYSYQECNMRLCGYPSRRLGTLVTEVSCQNFLYPMSRYFHQHPLHKHPLSVLPKTEKNVCAWQVTWSLSSRFQKGFDCGTLHTNCLDYAFPHWRQTSDKLWQPNQTLSQTIMRTTATVLSCTKDNDMST